MSPPRLSADWLAAPAPCAVMAALGGRARFVGGCVRNTLMGLAVSDIDLATPLVPEEVTRRLEAAGLRAVPTGLEHGTVTAVADGHPLEITTYRADIRTFGRHAEVRFTTDIAEDAARRDFTMNALYADAAGEVIDPLGGLPDLAARRVRFIGAPEDRIREDYLRILRFYRFTAWYAHGEIDGAGQAACARLADGLAGLARERIGAETRKLLAAPDPGPALRAMAAAGALAACLPGAEVGRLDALLAAERAAGAAPDWRRRLAALGLDDAPGALRLSRAESRTLETLARLAASDAPPELLAEEAGAEAARSAVLLRCAATGAPVPEGLEDALAAGAAACFPLTAKDLLAAGWQPGPALGDALAAARAAWRESRFALDRDALLARLPPPG